jgi:mannose-6-phosphate isomerase-like protein (cupin superfamily)
MAAPPTLHARPAAPCPWPDSLDAVRAAPENHRVLLENDRVRVLDVTVPAGGKEPIHAHCLPSVLVVLEGGRARDFDDHGKLIEEGEVIPPGATAPFAFWLDRTPPHSVHNTDIVPIHLVRVELKQAALSSANAAGSQER